MRNSKHVWNSDSELDRYTFIFFYQILGHCLIIIRIEQKWIFKEKYEQLFIFLAGIIFLWSLLFCRFGGFLFVFFWIPVREYIVNGWIIGYATLDLAFSNELLKNSHSYITEKSWSKDVMELTAFWSLSITLGLGFSDLSSGLSAWNGDCYKHVKYRMTKHTVAVFLSWVLSSSGASTETVKVRNGEVIQCHLKWSIITDLLTFFQQNLFRLQLQQVFLPKKNRSRLIQNTDWREKNSDQIFAFFQTFEYFSVKKWNFLINFRGK